MQKCVGLCFHMFSGSVRSSDWFFSLVDSGARKIFFVHPISIFIFSLVVFGFLFIINQNFLLSLCVLLDLLSGDAQGLLSKHFYMFLLFLHISD